MALVVGSVAIAVIFAVVMVILAWLRPLSPLETILFQIVVLGISLGGGLFGSYKFGQNSAANKQHARSALRSVIVLHQSILQLSSFIASLNERGPDRRLYLLQNWVRQLAMICSAAIADWRDVIPDDFEDVGNTLEQSEPARRNPENDDSNRTDSR